MLKSSAKDAVVIGAGLSGLTAAYRLKQAGYNVVVLEKNDYPGGRVLTLRKQGYIVDSGPDAISAGYTNYLGLVDELGLHSKVVPSSPVAGIVRDGIIHNIDLDSTRSLIFTQALSFRAKFKFALGYLRIRHLLKGLDNFALVASAHLDDTKTTAQQFGEKYFGKEVTNYLIDPLMRLVAGTGAQKTTYLSLLGGLKAWSYPLVNLQGGLDILPKTIATQLDVRYESAVTQVEKNNEHISMEYRSSGGDIQKINADVCVISTMYDVVKNIYPSIAKIDNSYHYDDVKLISITLGYKKITHSKAYAVQVPTIENSDILLIFLQHNKAPDRAPKGCSLITLYTDTAVTDQFAKKSDQALAKWANQHIEKLFPELTGCLHMNSISRWPKAGYLATPGFFKRTQSLLATLAKHDRIQIAGDLFAAGSMESAVKSGNDAAQNIIEHYS